MTLTPEQHHRDCDYRNSYAAKEAAETFGVDVAENNEVFECNLGCSEKQFVIIDYADETRQNVLGVTGPFKSEEEADQWDEGTGQRWGHHDILELRSPWMEDFYR